jgi:pimeloyl-ACP methyl ester carboxylesterase
MSAPREMHVELVRTVTRDGLRLDGALAIPLPPGEGGLRRKPGEGLATSPTAAILLHGVASNFYTSSTFEPLIPRLQALGLAVLSVNTRGHDSVFGASLGNVRRRFGAAYEIVDDCRHDVAAWIELLKSRGHKRIVLIGHSLGAVKAVYAHAHEKFAEVSAVIAVSAPRLSHSAFMNAAEGSIFWESMHAAEEMVKAGQGDELFTSKFPFPMLMTAAAYIDKYGLAERYNLLKFAANLPCPALFTYGSKELASGGVPFAGVPESLAALPNAEWRTVAIIDGADHVYTGVSESLAHEVVNWLRSVVTAPVR